jgi:hypothetical protein
MSSIPDLSDAKKPRGMISLRVLPTINRTQFKQRQALAIKSDSKRFSVISAELDLDKDLTYLDPPRPARPSSVLPPTFPPADANAAAVTAYGAAMEKKIMILIAVCGSMPARKRSQCASLERRRTLPCMLTCSPGSMNYL